MPYSEKLLEHFTNPRNVGTLDKKSPRVGTGVVGNPRCGDVMQLQLEIDDALMIVDAKFKTFGCGAAIAASSLATEWLKGRTLAAAEELRNRDIAKELSLPPIKVHCSVLAEKAVRAAIVDWKRKHGQVVEALAGEETQEGCEQVCPALRMEEALRTTEPAGAEDAKATT
jgi:nitrogen fixation NifU-like protein